MTTEQRLERLERENRWMRRIGAVAVAVAAAVFLIGQGKKNAPPDLVVRSLKVVDKDGKVRAYLVKPADGSATLGLMDSAGRMRVLLQAPDRMPALRIMDKAGKKRVILSAGLSNLDTVPVVIKAALEPSLKFCDANRKVIWKAPKD